MQTKILGRHMASILLKSCMVVIGWAIQLKLKCMCPFKLYLLSKQRARSSDFGMNFRTVGKQNKEGIFFHILHFIGRKFDVFVKMERIHQNFCVYWKYNIRPTFLY
jgi:hypothetical protein